MPHSPLSRYRQLIDYCEISPDAGQEAVVERLQALYQQAMQVALTEPSGRFFSRWFGKAPEDTTTTHGLYLWGGVGRGKSMLMDMFFRSLDRPDKRRVHFHGFMLEVHAAMHTYRQQDKGDPLVNVANDIREQYGILCFDELQVHDITDAMILARLFEQLFTAGIQMVFTSNRPPEDLYKDGLQREQFLPFIDLIRRHLEVMEITSDKDYRQGRMAGLTTRYFTPDTPETRHALATSFSQMIGYDAPVSLQVPVQGRILDVPKACREVAWFSFADLCDAALGATDYLELTQLFRTFYIEGIPIMTPEMRNQAKRFVTLIDVLYEAQAHLFCTAADEPEWLYKAGDGSFEFERTASRLREMMSGNYGS